MVIAYVQVRGDEARRVKKDVFGRLRQARQQCLGLLGFNGKRVDEDEVAGRRVEDGYLSLQLVGRRGPRSTPRRMKGIA